MLPSFVKIFSWIFVCLTYVTTADAANILAVFPTPCFSHQVAFRPYTQELARRGHEVTVITTDPAFPNGQTPQNLIEIDIRNISYKYWDEFYSKQKSMQSKEPVTQIMISINFLSKIFLDLLKTKEMKLLMHNNANHYDLLVLEACVVSTISLTHIFKAPAIQISSFTGVFDNWGTVGAPSHPLLYPINVQKRLYNLMFNEKLDNYNTHQSYVDVFHTHEEMLNKNMRKHFGEDFPSMSELKNNVHMLFLSVNPVWIDNQPVPPSVIFTGGLHEKTTQDLPMDLKSFLDSSENGVIYVSFGSTAKSSLIPNDKVQVLMKVLSKVSYDVLCKWEEEARPNASKNIRFLKWLPQSDLLKHPNIKLFITQCGLQSTMESMTAGVPLIGMPISFDQYWNAEKYEKFKIGIKILWEDLTEITLEDAIQNIVENTTYKENVVKFNKLLKDEKQSPLERAVWWTEHLLSHSGARHLRAAGANISWAEYLEIELILYIVLLSFFIITLNIKFLMYLKKMVRNVMCG